MRDCPFFHRFLAATLLFPLALSPTPAYALRAGLEGHESEVGRTLSGHPHPAAGMEEVDPVVREAITEFLARPDMAKLAGRLAEFTSAQRVQWLRGFVWLADRPAIPAVIRDALVRPDAHGAAPALRAQLFKAIEESLGEDGFRGLQLIVGALPAVEAKQATVAITQLRANGLVPNAVAIAVAFAEWDAAIREQQERVEEAEAEDHKPLAVLAGFYGAQAAMFDGQPPAAQLDAYAAAAHGFSALHASTYAGRTDNAGTQTARIVAEARSMTDNISRRLQENRELVRETQPALHWFLSRLLWQWTQAYGDFLAEFESSETLRPYRDLAKQLEREMTELQTQRLRAYGVTAGSGDGPTPAAGAEEIFRELQRFLHTTIIVSDPLFELLDSGGAANALAIADSQGPHSMKRWPATRQQQRLLVLAQAHDLPGASELKSWLGAGDVIFLRASGFLGSEAQVQSILWEENFHMATYALEPRVWDEAVQVLKSSSDEALGLSRDALLLGGATLSSHAWEVQAFEKIAAFLINNRGDNTIIRRKMRQVFPDNLSGTIVRLWHHSKPTPKQIAQAREDATQLRSSIGSRSYLARLRELAPDDMRRLLLEEKRVERRARPAAGLEERLAAFGALAGPWREFLGAPRGFKWYEVTFLDRSPAYVQAQHDRQAEPFERVQAQWLRRVAQDPAAPQDKCYVTTGDVQSVRSRLHQVAMIQLPDARLGFMRLLEYPGSVAREDVLATYTIDLLMGFAHTIAAEVGRTQLSQREQQLVRGVTVSALKELNATDAAAAVATTTRFLGDVAGDQGARMVAVRREATNAYNAWLSGQVRELLTSHRGPIWIDAQNASAVLALAPEGSAAANAARAFLAPRGQESQEGTLRIARALLASGLEEPIPAAGPEEGVLTYYQTLETMPYAALVEQVREVLKTPNTVARIEALGFLPALLERARELVQRFDDAADVRPSQGSERRLLDVLRAMPSADQVLPPSVSEGINWMRNLEEDSEREHLMMVAYLARFLQDRGLMAEDPLERQQAFTSLVHERAAAELLVAVAVAGQRWYDETLLTGVSEEGALQFAPPPHEAVIETPLQDIVLIAPDSLANLFLSYSPWEPIEPPGGSEGLEPPAAGLEEWQDNVSQLARYLGILRKALGQATDQGNVAVALLGIRAAVSPPEAWANLVYVLTEHREETSDALAAWLEQRQTNGRWNQQARAMRVLTDLVIERFQQDSPPTARQDFVPALREIAKMRPVPTSPPRPASAEAQAQFMELAGPQLMWVISRVAEVINYPQLVAPGAGQAKERKRYTDTLQALELPLLVAEVERVLKDSGEARLIAGGETAEGIRNIRATVVQFNEGVLRLNTRGAELQLRVFLGLVWDIMHSPPSAAGAEEDELKAFGALAGTWKALSSPAGGTRYEVTVPGRSAAIYVQSVPRFSDPNAPEVERSFQQYARDDLADPGQKLYVSTGIAAQLRPALQGVEILALGGPSQGYRALLSHPGFPLEDVIAATMVDRLNACNVLLQQSDGVFRSRARAQGAKTMAIVWTAREFATIPSRKISNTMDDFFHRTPPDAASRLATVHQAAMNAYHQWIAYQITPAIKQHEGPLWVYVSGPQMLALVSADSAVVEQARAVLAPHLMPENQTQGIEEAQRIWTSGLEESGVPGGKSEPLAVLFEPLVPSVVGLSAQGPRFLAPAAGLEEPVREFGSVDEVLETLRQEGAHFAADDPAIAIARAANARAIDLPSAEEPMSSLSTEDGWSHGYFVVYALPNWYDTVRAQVRSWRHVRESDWEKVIFQTTRYPWSDFRNDFPVGRGTVVGIRSAGDPPMKEMPNLVLAKPEDVAHLHPAMVYSMAANRLWNDQAFPVLSVLAYTDAQGRDRFAVFL